MAEFYGCGWFYYCAMHCMQAQYVLRLFCLSVCPSHLWSVSKWLNTLLVFSPSTILAFSHQTPRRNSYCVSLSVGALNIDDVWKIRNFGQISIIWLYLGKNTRYACSYRATLIGNRIWSIKCVIADDLEWPLKVISITGNLSRANISKIEHIGYEAHYNGR